MPTEINRAIIEQQLQEHFNSLQTYEEKFSFIYNLFISSQKSYIQAKGDFDERKFLDSNFKKELMEKLVERQRELGSKFNDSAFVDFINDNIASRQSCPHVKVDVKDKSQINSNSMQENKEEIVDSNILMQNKNIIVRIMEDSLILEIKSFARKNLKQDITIFNKLNDYLKENGVIQNIIIDIRGNGGGSDEYFDYLSIFSDETISYTAQYHDNILEKNIEDTYTVMEPKTSKHYNRYLLTDGQVFSTADILARICKQTNFATVIGQPTKGEGYSSITPYNIDIMSSGEAYKGKYSLLYDGTGYGATFKFSGDSPINGNGQIDYSNYNVTPDIVCKGSDALQVAFREIDKKKSSKISPIVSDAEQKKESQENIDLSSEKPFDQRTQGEIQIANQIREKNQLIAKKKQQQRQKDKPKVLTKAKPLNSNNGFIDTIILSLIISFVAGALAMLTYFLIG